MLPIMPNVFLACFRIQFAAVVEWAFYRKDGIALYIDKHFCGKRCSCSFFAAFKLPSFLEKAHSTTATH